MFGAFRKTKDPGSTLLATRLRDYPAFPPVHCGSNGALADTAAPRLTPDQLRENYAAHVAAMPARIAQLRGLLAAFAIDVDQAYDDARRADFVAALHLMLLAELPALYRPELVELAAWEASDRSGPRIVHSLIADLAILFCDVLIAAKPGCFMGMDLDPADRNMIAHGRPVLLGLVDRLFPKVAPVHYFDAELLAAFRMMDDPHAGRFDPPEAVARGLLDRAIGHPLLVRIERDIVPDDIAARRQRGWLAKAAG